MNEETKYTYNKTFLSAMSNNSYKGIISLIHKDHWQIWFLYNYNPGKEKKFFNAIKTAPIQNDILVVQATLPSSKKANNQDLTLCPA